MREIPAHPGIRPAGMIAQRDKPESHHATALTVGIALPMEVIIVQDRPIQQRTLLGRHNDDRRGLNQRTGGNRLARKNAAALYRIAANFKTIVAARLQMLNSARPMCR